MNIRLELERLQADIGGIEAVLADLPDDGNVLERIGLESQRDELVARLASLKDQAGACVSEHAEVSLVFGGKPVSGDHGIDAKFAADRLGDYQDLVASIHADRASALKSKGTGPRRDDARLAITGIALGCFGFRLEEVVGSLAGTGTGISDDIATLNRLLEGAAEAEDDFLAAASTTSERVLSKLKEFCIAVDRHDATMRIEAARQSVSLNRARVRVARATMEETKVTHEDARLRAIGASVSHHATTSASVGFRHLVGDRIEKSTVQVAPGLTEADLDGLNATLRKAVDLDVEITKATAHGKTRSSYQYRRHTLSPFNAWFERLKQLQPPSDAMPGEESMPPMAEAFAAARGVLERLWLHRLDHVESIQLDADGGVGIYVGRPTERYLVILCDLEGAVGVLCAERGGNSTSWDLPGGRGGTDALEDHFQRMAAFLADDR